MSRIPEKILCASAGAFVGCIGFSYTNPKWTQRRFNPKNVPPLLYQQTPSREDCLKRMEAFNSPENPMDVIIVGGGSVGAGVALDATTRGMTVGLFEMNDYASGTSSRSTKLIHGGIRYLEKAVFKLDMQQLMLVAEALRERIIMSHQAPHLCRSIPTMIPCYNPIDIAKFWCGVKLYDIIAMWERGTLEYAGYLTPYAALKKFPYLKNGTNNGKILLGAVEYYDGQMNDARLCLSAALTAASYGAATVNYAKVEKMEVVQNKMGEQVVKATVQDRINSNTLTVYGKSVVNAGGPFTARIQKLITDKTSVRMAPSSGTHIIIDRKYCPRDSAMVIPSNDGRVVFSAEWLGGCLVGTTDKGCEVTEDIRPTKSDIKFLLNNVEPYVGKVSEKDVLSAWCGIRPLALPENAEGSDTQNIVREHMVVVDKDNLMVSVVGGKWTTYRKIAQDTVDALYSSLLKGRVECKPCITEELQVIGAHELETVPEEPKISISNKVHKFWRRQYGDRYHVLADMVREDPSLLKPLHPEEPVLAADVVYSAQREHCERVVDFISRRTRLSFLNVEHAKAIIPEVAQIMATTKNWSRARKSEEVAHALAALESFHGQ
ncbi:glycerol-3-phosphate dehydrogenase (FAD-dependent), mitochondrial [Trypanosoma equiperdum]|uniref:Glycerol-3-phosphate dehydrogenase n=2 Tax=Trypanozoon TaxID=39700 RepID=Q384S7_TRYB2|nr:glycerol-3-phosphate dehydrogenase, putative [Trypanosoma brucei brucei TREU927]EAN79704.1 glycerol-3-phosphate dehydrogenase, putative [Trypanosoma brucei brucei TREU927]SCU70846.1 glycerol-3-phosphate dehydrogenase (FAD-dependent), mitochondrial [Trypanosoma equiperdum]